jgi:ABC transport system ATP-binding/permease protein
LLSQVDKEDPTATVGDVVLGSKEKHEWASDAAVREIFTGLFGGFDDHLFERIFSSLSGGEKRRVSLAKLLIDDLDLILLDEPTNHLDVEGVAWLADHLNKRKSLAVLVITHDRWFLDAVTDHTWEVVTAKLKSTTAAIQLLFLPKPKGLDKQVLWMLDAIT